MSFLTILFTKIYTRFQNLIKLSYFIQVIINLFKNLLLCHKINQEAIKYVWFHFKFYRKSISRNVFWIVGLKYKWIVKIYLKFLFGKSNINVI